MKASVKVISNLIVEFRGIELIGKECDVGETASHNACRHTVSIEVILKLIEVGGLRLLL